MTRREAVALSIGLLALIAGLACALLLGADLGGLSEASRARIIFGLRVPEALAAAGAGAALGLSGLLFQLSLRNNLADPYVMGVAGGSAFGSVSALLILGNGAAAVILPARALCAFVSGMATLSILRRAARGRVVALLLGGVIANTAFAAAARVLAALLSPGQIAQVTVFLLGYVPTPPVWEPSLLLACVAILGAWAVYKSRTLDLLLLADDEALALGADVDRVRSRAMAAGTLLAAAAVTLCGMIGFIGLLIPHAARALSGHRHRTLVPLSCLLGAALLLFAHSGAKALAPWVLLPVGAYTSLLGAPAFLWLMVRANKASMTVE